jgi:adenylate cyclase
MMRHLHLKTAGDIAHYREGLLKAGIPFGKVALIESSPKLAADS